MPMQVMVWKRSLLGNMHPGFLPQYFLADISIHFCPELPYLICHHQVAENWHLALSGEPRGSLIICLISTKEHEDDAGYRVIDNDQIGWLGTLWVLSESTNQFEFWIQENIAPFSFSSTAFGTHLESHLRFSSKCRGICAGLWHIKGAGRRSVIISEF